MTAKAPSEFRPKPGTELTYTTGETERTGIVLDRAQWLHHGWDVHSGKRRVFDHEYAVWVHRPDGTFDKVAVVTKGPRKGYTHWLGQYAASGVLLDQHGGVQASASA